MGTVGFMSERKKKETDRSKDRHLPSRQMRVRKRLADALDRLAERNDSTAPSEANRAIRELLEREGLWPLKD